MLELTVDRNAQAVREAVLKARADGEPGVTVNNATWDFGDEGYCQRCARLLDLAVTGLPMPHAGATAASTCKALAADPDIPRVSRDEMVGGEFLYFACGSVGHVIEYCGDGLWFQNTSRQSRGTCGEPPTDEQWGRLLHIFRMLPPPVAVDPGWAPGPIDIRLAGAGSIPGWLNTHCIVGVGNLGILLGLPVGDEMLDHRAVTLGYSGDVLPQPMAQYPGYAPGPITVATSNGGVDAWFTAGQQGHAVVGLRAVCDVLGEYDVQYDPAARVATLTRKAGA